MIRVDEDGLPHIAQRLFNCPYLRYVIVLWFTGNWSVVTYEVLEDLDGDNLYRGDAQWYVGIQRKVEALWSVFRVRGERYIMDRDTFYYCPELRRFLDSQEGQQWQPEPPPEAPPAYVATLGPDPVSAPSGRAPDSRLFFRANVRNR